MPIVLNPVDGAFVLRCVSNHPNQPVLRRVDGVHSMVRVDAVGNGPLVVCFYCPACGYVETYLAQPGGVAGPPNA